MFNKYYRQELKYLRDAASEYSKAHPAIAPMLDGSSSDPDVERILEGTAFLTGLVRQKIDDEFPEIVHELIRNVWPHYLRPVPSATMIEFSTFDKLQQTVKVEKGISLDSVPVDNTSCRFKTIYDMEVHPLEIEAVSFQDRVGKPAFIKLDLKLNQIKMSSWKPEKIRFYLADQYIDASYLFMILAGFVKCIRIKSADSGVYQTFPKQSLAPVGFSLEEGLVPYPSNAFPGYRLLQEYFMMPEKFLFFDFNGIKDWADRGEGEKFEIIFELEDLPAGPPELSDKSFKLNVTPAVNIFPHDADPIYLDHKKYEYRVRPTTDKLDHYQVYSIENVVGFKQGASKEREYLPFHSFRSKDENSAVYNESLKLAPGKNRVDHYISTTTNDPEPDFETLSITLNCTNGFLAEYLETGDITVPAETTPEFVSFTNIKKPTVSTLPAFNENYLWQLLSMMSLNNVSLTDVDSFRALLTLYIFEGSHDKVAVNANKKRVQGIKSINTQDVNQLVSGCLMRGKEITLKIDVEHFAGMGDLYLFSTMISHFTALYTTINSFTRLVVEEVMTGEKFIWQERIGDRYLI